VAVLSQLSLYHMTKKRITILLIAIGLAMLALIAIQSFWIKQAFELKDLHFGQLVNNAVHSVCIQLQEKEIARDVLNSVDLSESAQQSVISPNSRSDIKITYDSTNRGYNYKTDSVIRFYNEQDEKIKQFSEELLLNEQNFLLSAGQMDPSVFEENMKQRQKMLNEIERDQGHRKQFVDKVMRKLIKPSQQIENRIKRKIFFTPSAGSYPMPVYFYHASLQLSMPKNTRCSNRMALILIIPANSFPAGYSRTT
jgi:hypothetical protein